MNRFLLTGAAAVTAIGISVAVATPAEAASSVHFGPIRYDSIGKDTRSQASLNGEYAKIVNSGGKSVSLKNWSVRDLAGHRYVFPTFTLGAHKTVILHTGSGNNNASNVYWKQGNYIWNNTGDAAGLRTPSGVRVDVCSWRGGAPGYTMC